jgi:hypothetical protein
MVLREDDDVVEFATSKVGHHDTGALHAEADADDMSGRAG